MEKKKGSSVGLMWSFTLPLWVLKSSFRDSYAVKVCVGGLNKCAAGYVLDSAGSGWPSSSAPSYWSPASGPATWLCCGGTRGRRHPPGPGARWASPPPASPPPCSCCRCTRPLQKEGSGRKTTCLTLVLSRQRVCCLEAALPLLWWLM